MSIIARPITDRDTWLDWRRQNIGASEVGALFGAHPYLTALRLYATHRGVEFDRTETRAMRRGRLLETAVGVAVEDERPEWRLTKASDYLSDPELRLGATPDFWVESARGRGILQAKTARPSIYERDWNNGATVPLWVVLQTLVECMLSGASYGAAAVLRVDPDDLRCSVFDIERHPEAEARIVEAVRQFWLDVEAGREPPPDYHRDGELARMLVPHETSGKAIDLSGDNELAFGLHARQELMGQIDLLDARKEEIETRLRFKLGDAERATCREWNITYKTYHREEKVTPAKDIRALRINRRKTGP